MMEQKVTLSFHDLEIGYKDQPLSRPINLSLQEGELVALMGLNGVGKTTLFKTILKEQSALDGEIKFRGSSLELNDLQHSVGIVYTERTHIFGFTVRDMIAMGRMPHTNRFGKLSKRDISIVDSYVRELGLEEIEHKQIDNLSDGQFQKVMIARVLVQETPVILLDEPTAFLDMKNKVMIYKLLKKIAKEQKKTILVSTHQIDFCADYCDKALLFKDKALIEKSAQELSSTDFD
ncbi:MAG: ABC transporter ATP-binding protein [Flavobacteriales bacterium]